MSLLQFTDDSVLKRLSWVMVAVMAFGVALTLCGQPASFWHLPETAIRGDGLSIHNPTNHTFDFFLGRGWWAYLIASSLYIFAAFLLVSLLPRIAAYIAAFSVIFAHFFDANNWLAVRWHLGIEGTTIYAIVLSTVLVVVVFSPSGDDNRIIRSLRWVMLGAMCLDFTVTLIGQPASFWHNPATVHEANQVVRMFLGHGWAGYLLLDVFYFAGAFLLVTFLPRVPARICLFTCLLNGFNGPSCWFFYQWRLGMQAPILYGVVLSALISWLAFSYAHRHVPDPLEEGDNESLLSPMAKWLKPYMNWSCSMLNLNCRRFGG